MAIGAHRYEIYIRAIPDQVFGAITDPMWTRRFFDRTQFAKAPAAGESYTMELVGGDFAVEGDVVEIEPPHKLVHTWRGLYQAEMAAEPPSLVTWSIDAMGPNLTKLSMVHGQLARSPITWKAVKDGWVWVLSNLKSALETGQALDEVNTYPTIDDPSVAADEINGDWHRAQGVEANGAAWEIIENFRPEDANELLRRVYASAYHWDRATGREPKNDARSEYMIAKALLLAGQAHESLAAADRCLDLCAEHDLVDFDLAYSHEARARALAALGRQEDSEQAWAQARAVPIAGEKDREIALHDFSQP